MFPSVEPQALWAAEASPADVAAVRPLSCVKPEMVLEARSSCETLVTLWTVILLSKMDFLVFPQASGLVEAPVAQRAVVGSLSCVREPVSVHGARVGEALPAVRAGERLLPRVDFQVTFELTFLGELLPTQTALVRFLTRVNSHVDLKSRHLVTVSSTEPAAVRAFCQIVTQLVLRRWSQRAVFFTVGHVIMILFRHCGKNIWQVQTLFTVKWYQPSEFLKTQLIVRSNVMEDYMVIKRGETEKKSNYQPSVPLWAVQQWSTCECGLTSYDKSCIKYLY